MSSIDSKELLEEIVVVLNPFNTVADLIQLVQNSSQALFPVVSESGTLVGMIYLEDLPDLLPVYTKDPNRTLDQVMAPVRFAILWGSSAEHAMDLFERSKLNYLPVMENDQVVGYYSKARLLEAYRRKIMDNIVE